MLHSIIGLLLIGYTSLAPGAVQVLTEQASLNTLEERIGETGAGLVEDKERLERLASVLNGGRQQLDELSHSDSDAINQHRIKLLTILLDRQERKLQRLEEEREEVRHALTDLSGKVTGLRKAYESLQPQSQTRGRGPGGGAGSAQSKRELSKTNPAKNDLSRIDPAKYGAPAGDGADTAVAAGESAPPTAGDGQPDPGWPYLSSGSERDIAFARRRLSELAWRRENGQVNPSALEKVDLDSQKYVGSVNMGYLGDDLFSVIMKVRAGRQAFTLFGVDYWHTIPERDDQSLYRFIYDTSSVSNPRLYLFRESLIRQTESGDDGGLRNHSQLRLL